MLAIIGGSGLTQLSCLQVARRQVVRTPYGEPSGPLTFGRISGCDVIFMARHGYGHSIPPHRVNYRANLWALHAEGATHVVSVASVGGIRKEFGPGVLVIPHQLLDYTWGREQTYFEGGDQGVHHVDFTQPYSPGLRGSLLEAALRCGEAVFDGGVYATMQGPRLETAAEIDRLERDGADLVGMTGMPEAALARELSLPYAAIAAVVNHAAGRGESRDGVSLEAIKLVLEGAMARVRRILESLVASRSIG